MKNRTNFCYKIGAPEGLKIRQEQSFKFIILWEIFQVKSKFKSEKKSSKLGGGGQLSP